MGQPGPEGSAGKLTFARLNLEIQRDQLLASASHPEEGFRSHALEKMKGLVEGTKKLTADTGSWLGALDHGLGIAEKIGQVVIVIGEAFLCAAEWAGHLMYEFGRLGGRGLRAARRPRAWLRATSRSSSRSPQTASLGPRSIASASTEARSGPTRVRCRARRSACRARA